MTKLVLLATAMAALAAPAFADTPSNVTPIRFERDGQTYVGTMTDQGGIRRIAGREVGSSRTFDLRVSNGRVTGYYDGDAVDYPAPVRLIAAR